LVTEEQRRERLCGFCREHCFPLSYGVRIQQTHARRAELHRGTLAVDPIRQAAERVMAQFIQSAERALVEQGIPLVQRAAGDFLRDQLTKRLGR
jgi:Ribonuclease G/E